MTGLFVCIIALIIALVLMLVLDGLSVLVSVAWTCLMFTAAMICNGIGLLVRLFTMWF